MVLLFIVTFAVSALLCALLTVLMLNYGARLGFVRSPTDRCAHDGEIARCGGIALYVSLLLVSSCLFVYGYLDSTLLTLFAGVGFLLTALGAVDDVTPLSITAKLIVQFSAMCTVLWLLNAPLLASLSLTLQWGFALMLLIGGMWWLNLFNFMDGIDGIASVEALYVCMGLLLFSLSGGAQQNVSLSLLLVIYLGVILGFLWFNWSPAKLFLGDSGSLFLGYSLGALILWSIASGAVSLWAALILVSVFVVDASLTLVDRILRRENWHQPHDTHLYQLLAQRLAARVRIDKDVRSVAHRQVCIVVCAVNVIWLLPLAYLANRFAQFEMQLLLLAYLPLVGSMLYARFVFISQAGVKPTVLLQDVESDA